ncbi:hypothetical protein [Nonomuraea sp. NPDC049480]|uniref:hypothetical protein n=1 Tax=Nonomuraea sp. NPDC049480 TaxID=3364353 RepID=UPI00379B1402
MALAYEVFAARRGQTFGPTETRNGTVSCDKRIPAGEDEAPHEAKLGGVSVRFDTDTARF